MTNLEATIAAIQTPGYDEGAVGKALIDAGINGADQYSSGNAKSLDLVAIEVLTGMLAVASISEGGYRIGYSEEGLKVRIGMLKAKWGIKDTSMPTVNGVQRW